MAFPRAAGRPHDLGEMTDSSLLESQPRLQKRPLPEDDEPADRQGTTADDPPQTYRMDTSSQSYEFTDTPTDISVHWVCRNCGHDGFRLDKGQWHCTECGQADYRASTGADGHAGWTHVPRPSTAQQSYQRAQYDTRSMTTPFRTPSMGTMPTGSYQCGCRGGRGPPRVSWC